MAEPTPPTEPTPPPPAATPAGPPLPPAATPPAGPTPPADPIQPPTEVQPAIQPTMLRPPAARPAWQTPVGLLLVLPAFILLLTSYVEPLVWTIRSSFQRLSVLRVSEGSAGGDNYSDVFDDGLGAGIGKALLYAVVPLLAVLIVAPVLAFLAHKAGTVGRWAARGLLVLPLVAYAPTAVGAAAVAARAEAPLDGDRPLSGLVVSWLAGFGLTAALAVTLYLAALRRREAGRSPVPALLAAAAIAVLAVLAVSLQTFTIPYLIEGGRAREAALPVVQMFYEAFVLARLGSAAAVSTILLAILMVLGLAATLLVILSRLRLEYDETTASADTAGARRSPLFVLWLALAGVIALVVLVVTWAGLGDWLSRITDSAPDAKYPNIGVNTWIPPLIATVIGVAVAALAAFGISALRPLGRHSEWLLLPFGLFLFVGVEPLAIREFASGVTASRMDTFIGLIPPGRVAIPALFVLALLFRGQALRRETLHQEGRPTSWGGVILPALPMLALALLVTWVVSAQDLLWGLITGLQKYADAQTFLFMSIRVARSRVTLPFSDVLPVWALILLFLLALAAQLLYVDRVALRVGRPERDHPPRT